MAAADILKNKNYNILATVWPIGTAFDTMTHIDPPNQTSSWNFELLKIQDGGRPPAWKIEKCSINGH